MKIAVFCSASDRVTPRMKSDAATLARWIGESGSALVYGGIPAGLMATVAAEALAAGGHVTGVVPESRRDKANPADSETIIVADLHERKRMMEQLADAFIALPGGYGTLDEVISTWASLGFEGKSKPIILLNTDGYYDPLRLQTESMHAAGLLSDLHASELTFTPTVEATINMLKTFNR